MQEQVLEQFQILCLRSNHKLLIQHLAEFDRNRAIQEQTLRDQQAKLGVLGAGRAGVQLAEYGSGADREESFTTSRIITTRFWSSTS